MGAYRKIASDPPRLFLIGAIALIAQGAIFELTPYCVFRLNPGGGAWVRFWYRHFFLGFSWFLGAIFAVVALLYAAIGKVRTYPFNRRLVSLHFWLAFGALSLVLWFFDRVDLLAAVIFCVAQLLFVLNLAEPLWHQHSP